MRGTLYILLVFSIAGIICFSSHPPVKSVRASGIPFQSGQPLAGVGSGKIKHFDADGTFLDLLDTGVGNTEDTGMAFDAANNLYTTVFQGNNVYKFDPLGNRLGTFGSGYNQDPESIVFDSSGNAYVGQADGARVILKFNASGALIDTFSPVTGPRGTDWIDLASDQCTMHYTSEGSNIRRYNVCTRTQLPDFATGLAAPCYGHRIRPNGEELVACASQVYRLNNSGGVVRTYQLPGSSLLFALNLDPDNKTFWTADLLNGNVYHVEIATGVVIKQFNAGITQSLAGLALAGEITAATTAPPFTTSYYITTTKSATMANLGRDTALSQLASDANRDYVVALLFGAPTLTNGKYGATGFTSSVPVATIAGLVEAFASGYYNNLGNNKTLHLRIVIATSNGTTSAGGNQVTFEHGKAWAQMVGDVTSWVVSQRYVSQVDIAGGSDMEFSASVRKSNGTRVWADPVDTRAWVNGYASVLPQRFLYDVGDAGGCPTSGTTAQPRACNGGWTQEDAWYVSWGADPSQPLPEIYTTTSSQAKQWANLSLYGALQHGTSMIISGALTQSQACQQRPCDASTKNSPVNGWTQLFNQVNADARTAQTLAWSTDIKWGPQ